MNDRSNVLPPAEIWELFANTDPDATWEKALRIVRHIRPDFDDAIVRPVFDDVVRLFNGSYPEYHRISTPYHDLSHTLSVFICAVRLLHGTHLADTRLSDDEISLVLIASILHDVGYAQKMNETGGSGAQHLRTHVQRGIDFMLQNSASWHLPQEWRDALVPIIRCTDLGHQLLHIPFPSPRIRLLGQIVGSADIVGQMADRTYLEKLLYLYYEFEEARFGNYQNMLDMLRKTRDFYELIRKSLNDELGGVHQNLRFHFKEWLGTDRNFYLESIEKNIAYLNEVISLDESMWLAQLKRQGIVKNALQMNQESGKQQ